MTFFPETSLAVKPKSFSAVALNDCILPRLSITTIALGTVARMERR
nr:hypothetical protein SFHH103_04601 [Sinorhizobium fredii HH103]